MPRLELKPTKLNFSVSSWSILLNITQSRTFSENEAKNIGNSIGINWSKVSLKEFGMGLSVELEHGSHDAETNVINNDESLAGKIAWAHLKELPDYYTRLKKMEKEGEGYWQDKK